MENVRFKAKNLDGVWIEGSFIPQYHSSKKCRQIDAIFWSDKFKTYREEIYTNTLTRFVPMLDKNIEGLWIDSDIFEFDFNDPIDKTTVTLRGIMTFDDLELRYQVDVYSKRHPQYACLSYNPELMHRFKVIGNKIDNPKLLK